MSVLYTRDISQIPSGTFTGILIRRFLDLLREISRANFFPMASSDFHLPRIPKTFFYEIEDTFFRFELGMHLLWILRYWIF